MIDQMYFGGGLVAEPELRDTPNGHAVAQFRLAQSDYKKTEQGWEKTNARYLQCSIWNDLRNKDNPKPWAEAIADLPKGTRIVVHGKLKTRSWETKEGEKRSTLELQADSFYVDGLAGVAPQQGGGQQTNQQPDPWANAPTQTPGGDEQPPF